MQMAYELYSMWQKLGDAFFSVQHLLYIKLTTLQPCLDNPFLFLFSGDNKPHFTPGMMGPFLGVTLVPQAEVRNVMVPIFHDMMDWEQRKNGNFKQVR